MNIAPTDASKAPFTPSGEVVDRMQGNLPGAASASAGGDDRFGDLKKGSSSGSSPGSSSGTDLKKKSVPIKKTKSVEDDDVEKVDNASEGAGEGQESAAAKPSADNDEGEAGAKPEVKKRRARKKWKKPRDKPNRPLSAYNLFFKKERALMLGDDADKGEPEKGKKRVHRKTHGKIGFAEMARIIGAKWKAALPEEKLEFEEVAAKEKTRYAQELKVWKEEQKKKEESAKKIAKIAKDVAKKGEHKDEGMGDAAGLTPEQQMHLRMQMMSGGPGRGGFPFLGGDSHQRPQMPTIEYLRAMQEDHRASMFGGGSFTGNSSAQQQFPNASEASANALLNQFQGMPQGAGMDGSGSGMSDFQQLQMARMQMMNSSMMGGPMGMMGGPMGMGGGFPPMSELEFQRLQQMRMMQGMNQMDSSNSAMSGSNSNPQQGGGGSSNMDAAMFRRLQNRFGGM